MPFPVSIRGSIPIPIEAANVSDQAIMLACVDQVEHERAYIVSHTDRSATFSTAVITWGPNWRFTVPLSAGSLEIETDSAGGRRLNYDFSTRRTTLIGTVMVIGMFVLVAAEDVGQFPWWMPVLFWLWLVGVNYLIPFFRAPSWVRRRISDAVEASAVSAPSRGDPMIVASDKR
jgi:hypothetical protein